MYESAETSEIVRQTVTEARRLLTIQQISVESVANSIGVSASFLNACFQGDRKLALVRLVQVCRIAGLTFKSVTPAIDALAGGTNYLRASRAANSYECSYCGGRIHRHNLYIRLEPFGPTRQSGAPVQYFCESCSSLAGWIQSPLPSIADALEENNAIGMNGGSQLVLPFASHVKETRVELVDLTASLSAKILANPNELFALSPSQFEELVLDRLTAMGLKVAPVGGGTFRRDGGIDIIFTPPRSFPVPFLGAVQVKHRRNPGTTLGPTSLRELAGVLSAQKHFAAGMIVTNTSFSPDARDFATRIGSTLRLRDFQDLMRWVAGNFVDDEEWREMPKAIELCSGLTIPIP